MLDEARQAYENKIMESQFRHMNENMTNLANQNIEQLA